MSSPPTRPPSSSPPRVLVASGSAGHGHTMAARSVVAALRERHPAVEVAHVDAVARMWSFYKHIYRRGYLRLVDQHPILWRALYENTDRAHPRLAHVLTRVAGAGFVSLARRWRPDVILCTHFLAPELLYRPVARGTIPAELHVVITDHDTHRSWDWPGIHRFYVASEGVKARLVLRFGVPEAHVEVTGIPVRREFALPADPVDVRLRYGLDPERPTVLFLSAGFAAGSMGQAILGLWRDRRDVQVIAVCGRNERLRRRIARLPRPAGAILHPLGFVQDVRGLMEVADVVVGKSGGISTAECMAAGRPLVISASIPGQEERNADAVVEAGAGVRALSPEEVRYRTGILLEDPDLRAAMARRARLFGRPDAAAEVADAVVRGLVPEELPVGPRFHGAV